MRLDPLRFIPRLMLLEERLPPSNTLDHILAGIPEPLPDPRNPARQEQVAPALSFFAPDFVQSKNQATAEASPQSTSFARLSNALPASRQAPSLPAPLGEPGA